MPKGPILCKEYAHDCRYLGSLNSILRSDLRGFSEAATFIDLVDTLCSLLKASESQLRKLIG